MAVWTMWTGVGDGYTGPIVDTRSAGHVDAHVWTDLEDACTRPVDHTRSAVGTHAHMWTHLGMHVQVY